MSGANAARLICQSGLNLSNCRYCSCGFVWISMPTEFSWKLMTVGWSHIISLVSEAEAFVMGLSDGEHAALLLGFESSHIPNFDEAMKLALSLCEIHGGRWSEHPHTPKTKLETEGSIGSTTATTNKKDTSHEAPQDAWKNNFLAAPYARDALIQRGYLSDMTVQKQCQCVDFVDQPFAINRIYCGNF